MPTNANLSSEAIPSRQDVLGDVKQIVSAYVSMPLEKIEETHTLITDLGCDSLDIIEITMEVEDHFDISVPDEEAQNINAVGDVADGVLRLLGQGSNR